MSLKLIKDSASYTAFNVIEKSIPFLILPLITRVLTKEEVGFYILYQAIVGLLLPAITCNIDSSILINYYKTNKDNFPKYFSNGIIAFIPIFIISITIITIFSDGISTLIKIPVNWLFIICLIILARFFTQLRQNLWRATYKIKEYGYFTIGISIVKNGLGILLLFYTVFGWEALVLGHLIGYWVFALIALASFHKEKYLKYDFNFAYFRDALQVGFPLSLHKVGLWLGNAVNKIIIASILGTAATGNYGIGATFAVLVTVIEDAFNKAFVPYLFEKLKNIDSQEKNEQEKKKLVSLSHLVYCFLVIITIIFYLIGYYGVGLIFGEEYLSTRSFLFPLLIAAMFKGFYKLHVNYIMFTKKTFNITKITLSTGMINIVMSYILIMMYGVIGAAYSLLIVNIIQYIITFYVGNKLIPMPWLTFKF